MFEVLDVVSSQKLLMSLTLKGFYTVPNETTVEFITPQSFTTYNKKVGATTRNNFNDFENEC